MRAPRPPDPYVAGVIPRFRTPASWPELSEPKPESRIARVAPSSSPELRSSCFNRPTLRASTYSRGDTPSRSRRDALQVRRAPANLGSSSSSVHVSIDVELQEPQARFRVSTYPLASAHAVFTVSLDHSPKPTLTASGPPPDSCDLPLFAMRRLTCSCFNGSKRRSGSKVQP